MGKKKQEWLKTVNFFVVVKISYLWHKLGQSRGKEINKRGNRKAKKGLNRSQYWPKLQCQNDSKFTKKYLNTKESQTILEEMQQVVQKQLNFGEENSLK